MTQNPRQNEGPRGTSPVRINATFIATRPISSSSSHDPIFASCLAGWLKAIRPILCHPTSRFAPRYQPPTSGTSSVHMFPSSNVTGGELVLLRKTPLTTPRVDRRVALSPCTTSMNRSNLCLSNVVQHRTSNGLPCASTTGRRSQDTADGENSRKPHMSDVARLALRYYHHRAHRDARGFKMLSRRFILGQSTLFSVPRK